MPGKLINPEIDLFKDFLLFHKQYKAFCIEIGGWSTLIRGSRKLIQLKVRYPLSYFLIHNHNLYVVLQMWRTVLRYYGYRQAQHSNTMYDKILNSYKTRSADEKKAVITIWFSSPHKAVVRYKNLISYDPSMKSNDLIRHIESMKGISAKDKICLQKLKSS